MAEESAITRREMLIRGTGAVVAGAAAVTGAYYLYDPTGKRGLRNPSDAAPRLADYFADVDFPVSNPRISIATGEDDRIEAMVRAAVGGLDPSKGMARFVSPGDFVLIKPNVGFDRAPHIGATTNPEVLRAVIRLCKEAGAASVLVADNPIEAPAACFAKSRLGPIAQEEGARVLLPSEARFVSVTLRDQPPDLAKNEVLDRWSVFHKPLLEANKIIGVAPIKDHNLCNASMNMKNWYGLLGGRRNQFHQAIHQIISDLALMFSPTLVIADGTRVMMRNGPTGGRTVDVKAGGEIGKPTVVASVDQIASDAWCYQHLLGRDPAKLAYLEMAEQKIAAAATPQSKRLAQRDWQDYDNRGLITKASV